MKYRKFGSFNWQISEIGFGAWAIGGDMWGPQDDKESEKALHKALDCGINFIDTAQGYGKGHSESIIGKVLKDRNDEVYIATKIPPVEGNQWPPNEDADAHVYFPKEYIIKQCDDSLRRLQRDYIDIYQFHTWATAFNVHDEWFETMSDLKQQGKIRAIGVSVPDTTPDNVIGSLALRKVDAVQVIYNIFEQYPGWNLFPVCERLGIGVIVRVPFDEGALTGKFTADTTFPEGDVRRHYFRGNNLTTVIKNVERIKKVKDAYHPNISLVEYALRFCLSHQAVSTVIPGMRNEKQVEMNILAGDGIALSENELNALKEFAWRKDFWNEEVTE